MKIKLESFGCLEASACDIQDSARWLWSLVLGTVSSHLSVYHVDVSSASGLLSVCPTTSPHRISSPSTLQPPSPQPSCKGRSGIFTLTTIIRRRPLNRHVLTEPCILYEPTLSPRLTNHLLMRFPAFPPHNRVQVLPSQ